MVAICCGVPFPRRFPITASSRQAPRCMAVILTKPISNAYAVYCMGQLTCKQGRPPQETVSTSPTRATFDTCYEPWPRRLFGVNMLFSGQHVYVELAMNRRRLLVPVARKTEQVLQYRFCTSILWWYICTSPSLRGGCPMFFHTGRSAAGAFMSLEA